MRVKRLSMFALVPLLLVALCAQSAFAATWTSNGGRDHSTLSSSGNPSWTDAINQYIDVHLYDQFTWTNTWTNNYGSAEYYGYQWSSGIAYGTSWWSSGTVSSYTTTSPVTAQGSVYRVPFDGWTDLVNINHRYTGTIPSIGTDFLTTQGLTART